MQQDGQAARHRSERVDVLVAVELHQLLVHLLAQLVPRAGVPFLRLLLFEPVVALAHRLHLRLHSLHLLLHDAHLDLAAVQQREEQDADHHRQDDDRPPVIAGVALQELHRVEQGKRDDPEEPEIQKPL